MISAFDKQYGHPSEVVTKRLTSLAAPGAPEHPMGYFTESRQWRPERTTQAVFGTHGNKSVRVETNGKAFWVTAEADPAAN